MAATIVDTFLAMLHQHAGDGSHIITVVGVEHNPAVTVFQRYRDEIDVEDHFWSLFGAVQNGLDWGDLCVILVRSLLSNGAGQAPTIVLRAWTLTPVGIIPISGHELAAQSEGDPVMMVENAQVIYANGWDQDLDALD